jgi:hypothetical protein
LGITPRRIPFGNSCKPAPSFLQAVSMRSCTRLPLTREENVAILLYLVNSVPLFSLWLFKVVNCDGDRKEPPERLELHALCLFGLTKGADAFARPDSFRVSGIHRGPGWWPRANPGVYRPYFSFSARVSSLRHR